MAGAEKAFQAALAGVNGRTQTTGMSMVHPVDTLVFVTLGPLTISTMGISTMSLALMLWGARRGGQKVLIASAFASLGAAKIARSRKAGSVEGSISPGGDLRYQSC